MPTKQECDRFADELNAKFEELMQWAITNWPRKEFPLLTSDFDDARKCIADIAGSKLGEGDDVFETTGTSSASSGSGAGKPRGEPDYVDVTPMPWP